MSRSRVFFELSIGVEPAGRITIELYNDKAPQTCENFRSICTAENAQNLTYKLSTFHRVIDEFMIQGGDITKGDGTGGQSIYGEEFDDENIGWRDIDAEGLVCMANRGKDTNNSQFFITLAPCEHLNKKHTVFGRIVSGTDVINKIAKVKVDKDDRPLEDVVIARCGELERKKSSKSAATMAIKPARPVEATGSDTSIVSRGRDKRHEEMQDRSLSRSTSPVRPRHRRRSDAAPPDPTLRGRGRKRSHTPKERSPSPSRGHSKDRSSSRAPGDSRNNQRSPPIPRNRSYSPDNRRDRRSPNRRERDPDRRRDDRYAPRDDRQYSRRYDDGSGRLERGGQDKYGDSASNEGVKYKGRGSMKFREPAEQSHSGYGRLR